MRWITSMPNPDYPLDIEPDCESRLELELDVVFSTTDGYLDESFTTTARATSGDALSFDHYVDADELQGMLWPDAVSYEGAEITRFAMFARIADSQDPEGSFNVEVQGPGPDGGFAGFGALGVFPELPE